MADTATPEARVDALLGEVKELRREMDGLKAMLASSGPGRTREERLAGVQRLAAFHERVLRRGGGHPLLPAAGETAQMRAEAMARIPEE